MDPILKFKKIKFPPNILFTNMKYTESFDVCLNDMKLPELNLKILVLIKKSLYQNFDIVM